MNQPYLTRPLTEFRKRYKAQMEGVLPYPFWKPGPVTDYVEALEMTIECLETELYLARAANREKS